MRTGDVIDGRYQLEDSCGSGACGVVWTAFDRKLKRIVALKRPHMMASQADRLRFRREAETAAQVHHPNAISVFDTVDGDECWLVMEYSPADSLDKVLVARGPLPPRTVARIGLQIAAALAAVHAKKIVHRDVKPGNILVGEGDFAKLTDFGISLWREVTRTHDGRFSGTPAYAAPEVAEGHPATAASDVFSLGATLFAAVEGTPPFGTGEPDEVLDRVRRGDIVPMRQAGPLAPLLPEMLAQRPAKRPTAEQVRQRLKDIVGEWEPSYAATVAPANRTPFWRRPRYQALAAGVLAVAVGAAAFLQADPDRPPAPAPDLIGDQRTADPCALLDRKVFKERFGPAEMDTTQGNFNRCDVLIDVGAKEEADVEIQLVTQSSHRVEAEPFVVVHQPSDRENCERIMRADEKYNVRLTVKLANPPVDLCAIAAVAMDFVQATLRTGSLARRPEPFPAGSLANVNACDLVDHNALTEHLASDFNPIRVSFGNWECMLHSAAIDTTLHLRYDQHAAGDPTISGEETRLGDHQGYVKRDRGPGSSCTVSVLHSPATLVPRTATELVVLTVKSGQPDIDHCPKAIRLAAGAAARLPR